MAGERTHTLTNYEQRCGHTHAHTQHTDIGDFEDVEIIEILTKPGATIKKNDPIVTLESDKSSVEVPSPFEGKISSVEVKIGDKVSKGSTLATIEENQSEISENIKEKKKPKKIKQTKEEPLVLKEEEILPQTEKNGRNGRSYVFATRSK